MNGDYTVNGALQALYRWLDLMIRVNQNPDLAYSKLNKLLETENLSIFEEGEVIVWVKSLKRWKKDGGKIYLDFNKNKDLIKKLIQSKEPLYSDLDIVTLLRAASGFNKIIEKNDVDSKKHGEALYLLGLIYVNIPVLYIYELPEIYLKACIKKHPGSTQAKQAFSLLKQYVINVHTGSGGLHLDREARKELNELYKVAHGKDKKH